MIALLVCWKYYYFMSILNFYLESFGSEHSCHNKENYIEENARIRGGEASPIDDYTSGSLHLAAYRRE